MENIVTETINEGFIWQCSVKSSTCCTIDSGFILKWPEYSCELSNNLEFTTISTNKVLVKSTKRIVATTIAVRYNIDKLSITNSINGGLFDLNSDKVRKCITITLGILGCKIYRNMDNILVSLLHYQDNIFKFKIDNEETIHEKKEYPTPTLFRIKYTCGPNCTKIFGGIALGFLIGIIIMEILRMIIYKKL